MSNNLNGLNISFPIYYDDSNGVQQSFHDIVLRKATFDDTIMGLGKKISGDFLWIDNLLEFTMREYVVFNDVKYYIVNPATVVRNGLVKDNSDTKGATRYSVEFYHPEYMLSSFPFTDVAVSDDETQYLSESKTFSWIGNLRDFVAKLNKNLQETEWVCRLSSEIDENDERITKLSDVLPFDNQMVSDALKTAYDTWNVPFVTSVLGTDDEDYSEIKKYAITFGFPIQEILVDEEKTVYCDTYLSGQELFYYPTPIVLAKGTAIRVDNGVLLDKDLNVMQTTQYTATEYGEEVYIGHGGTMANVTYMALDIPFMFRFGKGVGLKNNSATPKNNKIVTRISGYGSEDNIPYGYPQIVWQGDEDAEFTIGDSVGVKENVTINGKTYAKAISYPIYKGIVGGEWVKLIKHPFTRKNLMPSIYEETIDKKVNPYNEDYDPDIDIIDYYDAPSNYPNPINEDAPSYEIHQFEDIKPRLWADGEKQIINAFPYDNVNETKDYITLNEFATLIENYRASLIKTHTRHNLLVDSTYEYISDPYEFEYLQKIYNNVLLGNDMVDMYKDQEHFNIYSCTLFYDTQRNWVTIQHTSPSIQISGLKVLRSNSVPSTDWNDKMNDDGEYEQSYFKITLPQLDFDLYACAAITQEMKINMRSGACIGCTFTIQCNWDDYKSVFWDDDGNFDPQGEKRLSRLDDYPDSTQGTIDVIVQKDLDTFGTIMPNIYQQPKLGDSFVILGISLPLTYIQHAQEELDSAMMEYMLENNVYYFEYPLTFDEKFLRENVNILNQIENNKLIRFLYGNTPMGLYVKQISINFGSEVLPTYSITLTDDIELVMNQLGQTTEDVSRLRVQVSQISNFYGSGTTGNVGGYASLQNQLDQKLSKIEEDVAKEKITFEKGLQSNGETLIDGTIGSSDFVDNNNSGMGKGWQVNANGNATFESVSVRSFMDVNELRVNRQQAQEGDTMFTDNDQIIAVEKTTENDVVMYKLTFKPKWEGYISPQVEGNILRGVINTLGANQANVIDASEYDDTEMDKENSYYVSWMLVVDDYTTNNYLYANQVLVTLYDDEAVPSLHNFPPCELMVVSRWGHDDMNTEQDDDGIAIRQRSFLISAKDGRITKLVGVNKPKLEDWMYGTTLGVLPDFVKNWAIVAQRIQQNERERDYLYSQGVVVQDFIKVDYEGKPIINYVDKGDWDETKSYLFEEWDEEDGQYETHEVWYNGEKWRAKVTNKDHIPQENSVYWRKILTKGTDGTSIVPKGNIYAHADTIANLRLITTKPIGSYGIVYDDAHIFEYNGTTWVGVGITASNGDGYIFVDDGHLWWWNGTIWSDAGQIKGDKGDNGTDGIGITNVVTTYALSIQGSTSDDETAPAIRGSWTTQPPTPTAARPYLWQRTITTYSNGTTTYTTTKYRLIAVRGDDGSQGEKGDKGDTGKMGRNFYFNGYSGDWQDSDKTFEVTDYEAPFVMVNDVYWVWVGDNGTYTFTQDNKPSNTNANWQTMVTDFEYLIAKAMFTDFAQLGSWIFNGDYMYSDQGKDSSGNDTSFTDGSRYYGDGNQQNTYTPNTIIDAYQGKIWTKSITLEGVVNNLIQNINTNNIESYGIYNNGTLYLNPLLVGNYVKIDMDGGTLPIHLPTLFINNDTGNPESYTITGALSTLDEIRQCVGKKIHFIPMFKVWEHDGESTELSTTLQFNDGNSMLVNKVQRWGSKTDINDLTINQAYEQKFQLSRTSAIGGYGTQQLYIAECKVGVFKGHECIYWEIESSSECLRDPITIID